MALTKEEVKHIALLARLGLTEEEIEKFAGQLSAILDYVKQLEEVDTEAVLPTAQVTGLENVMADDAINQAGAEVREELLKLAPEREDNLVKTKSVFE